MTTSVEVLGPSDVPNTVEAASGFQIGDGLYLTAGHVVFEYNHRYTPKDWAKISKANIVSSLNGASNQVALDPRGYQLAYAAQVQQSYQIAYSTGAPPIDNEHIEGKSPVYQNDMVLIKGGGRISSSGAGMVFFVNPSDLTSLSSVLSSASVHMDGVKHHLLSGEILDVASGVLTFSGLAEKGDSGGAFLLDALGKEFLLGSEFGITGDGKTKGTYFTQSDWTKINALLSSSQNGDVTNTQPTNLIVGSSASDAIHGTYRADIVEGGASRDTIDGGDGIGSKAWANDQLYGGAGNDMLAGGLGSNLLEGGNRTDIVSSDAQLAADGSDMADYSKLLGSSTYGIKIDVADTPVSQMYKSNPDYAHAVFVTDLANPHGSGKDVDTLISIETIRATDGDDVLSVTNLDRVLLANNAGLGGLNRVDFGNHKIGDVIDLTNLSEAARVDFAAVDRYISGTSGSTPKLRFTDAQIVFASSHGDTIFAGSGDLTIIGGSGNDNVFAGSGSVLVFARPGDNIVAGSGNGRFVIASGTSASPDVNVTTGSGLESIWFSAGPAPQATNDPSGPQGESYVIREQGTLNPGNQIFWNGYRLQGGTFEVLKNATGGEVTLPSYADWADSHGVVYHLDEANASLAVTLPDFSQLSIVGFHNGDFGMYFNASSPDPFAGVPRANIADLQLDNPLFDRNSLLQLTGHAEALSAPGTWTSPTQPDLHAFLM